MNWPINYETYTHGQAVAAGMCRAAELGVKLGVDPWRRCPGLLKSVRRVKLYDLPDAHRLLPWQDYETAVGLDKKGSGQQRSASDPAGPSWEQAQAGADGISRTVLADR